MKKPKCLHPRCNSESKCRGLCFGHYSYASLLVRQKKTSWSELAKNSKCLGISRISGVKSWFLQKEGK